MFAVFRRVTPLQHGPIGRMISNAGARFRWKKSSGKDSSVGSKSTTGSESSSSVSNHLLKTIITYAAPVLLFSGLSYYSRKSDEEQKKDKDSPGNLLRRMLKGEKVWEELAPRKEYIKVTRLNDRFNNYRYCLEQPSNQHVAEERIKHAEIVSRLRNTGLMEDIQQKLRNSTNSTKDLKWMQKAEEEYCASIKEGQEQMDKALRHMRCHSIDMPSADDGPNRTYSDYVLRSDLEQDGKDFGKGLEKQLMAEVVYMAKVSYALSDEERSTLKKYLSDRNAPGLVASHLYQEAPVSFAMLSGINNWSAANTRAHVGASADVVSASSSAGLELTPTNYSVTLTGEYKIPQCPRVYVLHFDGDILATQVCRLREEVTAVLQQSDRARGDSVVLRLNSSGGTVTGYGLAASQLERLRQAELPLTVCIDEVAASGGYMMACVANTICASPFAAVGSIGVVATAPNISERLKREGVEVTDITAGEYKRTLAPYKPVEEEDTQKVKDDVNMLFQSFQTYILRQRPSLQQNIAQVATGEVWHGHEALERGLVDKIRTVDDVLLDCLKANPLTEILQLQYVGDRIEAKEDRNRYDGWVTDGGAAAAICSAMDNSTGIGGGIIDKCLTWLCRHLVARMFTTTMEPHSGYEQLQGCRSGEILATSRLAAANSPMVRDSRFGH